MEESVDDETQVDEALRAIAEPRRRAILRLVAHDELAAGEIAAAFDVTRTAVSQHLTVLKAAGLLEERREGTRRLYRARPDGLSALREFLDDMWASALSLAAHLVEADRVGRTAEATADSPPHKRRRGTAAA
jgi:DNA-binding transcriptional ArsR family regulator